MADVLQNIHDVYKKWESRAAPNIRGRYNSHRGRPSSIIHDRRRPRSTYGVRNDQREPAAFERRNRRSERPPDKVPRYYGIAEFKMAPTIQPKYIRRPLMGLCCQKCVPQSRAAIPSSYIYSLCICNIFHMPFEEKNSVIPTSLRPLFCILCRSSKFKYPDVSKKVLQSERISYAMKKAVENPEEGSASKDITENKLLLEQAAKAQQILWGLKSLLSPFLLRISVWFLYKVLPGMFQSIQLHKGHIELLKSVNEEDCPIIYIPLQCSYLDYLLVSFILFMNDLKVPLLAINENLYVPIFGMFMRYLGAFFIQRKPPLEYKKKDLVYRTVLQEYLIECLKTGYSLEFFIEGSRSHDVKTGTPRSTLLSILVDSLLEGHIDDAYIVPVAVSYEKISDGNYVAGQLGKPKSNKNFLSSVFSIWKTMFVHRCSVRVDFGQPFSLKEFLHSNNCRPALNDTASSCIETPPSSPCSRSSSLGSLCGNESSSSDIRSVVRKLTDHIIYDANHFTALMSTQLVAFLLLTKHRQGATQPQLVCSLNWLREELALRKHDVGFTGESECVIKHAIALLGKELINTEAVELEWTTSDMENNNVKILFHKPIVKLPHVIELHYYSGFVIPLFLLDSIVVNGIYAVLDDEICHFQLCESKLMVSRQELVSKATELCNLLRFEFVCIPPCADIDVALNCVIEELIAKECLHITGAINYASGLGQKLLTKRSNYSFESSDDDEYSGSPNPQQQRCLKVDLSKESIDYLEFLRSILSPYIESYWLAACTLLKLLYETMEENVFIREIQRTAEDRLSKGLLGYEESFGTETLKNAIRLFKFWRVIEHYYEDDVKIIYLSESCNCEEKVNNVIARIEEFRK